MNYNKNNGGNDKKPPEGEVVLFFKKYWWVFLALIVFILFFKCTASGSGENVLEVKPTEFEKLLNDGTIEPDTVSIELKEGVAYFEGFNPSEKTRVYTQMREDSDVYKRIEAAYPDISVDIKKEGGGFLGFLFFILPFLFIGAFLFFMMRRMRGVGEATKIGRSRAHVHEGRVPRVSFSDVAGVEEAKEELQEVVKFLKSPQKFQFLGAKIPKGVLMTGPTGTGKTLLARAVAGEAGVPFFSLSGSEFVQMFVGIGAARVRDLFEQAKRNAPCIVFIDEIDAVGRHRGAGIGGGHDEREQTLNQILTEMDGFDQRTSSEETVIIIAATNRPDILDPALLRPGRFDRKVILDNPDVKGRMEILKTHLRGKPLAEDVDLDVLSKQTMSFSGADLANLVNEAAILAARRDKKQITHLDFADCLDKVIAGPERKSKVISRREKEITAHHEAGHVLVAHILPNADPPYKVSIIARGMSGGHTRYLPEEDRSLWGMSQFKDVIASAMGGRVAEQLVFEDITTGASNDLERATRVARAMVKQYGMSNKLGARTFGKREEMIFLGKEISEEKDYSEETAIKIDNEIDHLIKEAKDRAEQILQDKIEALKALACALLQHETLEGKELAAFLPEKDSNKPPE